MLHFFVETDIMKAWYNAGAAGENENGIFFRMLISIIKLLDELQIAFGMILLPFTHHNRQSAVSLLGVDYNTFAVNVAETQVWRDYGVEFRGLLANKNDRLSRRSW